MHKTSYSNWSIVAIVLYTAANAIALYYLYDTVFAFLGSVNWITLFILGLGAYRLTDIILYEKVTEPVRDVFVHEEKSKKHSSLQKFSNQLFTCNSCFGVWIATVTVYAYIAFPVQTYVIMLILCITGLERLFSKVVNRLEK